MKHIRMFSAAAAMAIVLAGRVVAQQPSASAAAFGMAGNYTAVASGYDAVAWNPASLGLRSSSAFSLTLLSVGGVSGLDPITPGDVSAFGGKLIPAATKETWLARVGAGTERGRADGGVTGIAMSMGWVAFQVAETAYGTANLNQDAVEAILYGNAGRTGSAKSLAFKGSNASAGAFTTGAASLAIPVSRTDDHEFSIGVTGKYVVGNAVMKAQDNGSAITPDNINVQFPIIYSPVSSDSGFPNNGTGMGADIGLAWKSQNTTFGVTVQNVVNTFKWSTAALKTKLGTAGFDGANSKASFDDTLYTLAPAAMRQALESESFKPEIAAGIAHRMSSLLVTADARYRLAGGIDIGPSSHVGVGAEFSGIPLLPLRAGVAVISGGWQVAGGAGLRLGVFELGAGAMLRKRDSGSEVGLMLQAISIR